MAARTRRKDFPDQIKAAAFERDRATCCYTGGPLWIADCISLSDFPSDWCDHRVPASLGGSADLTNALSASWDVNHHRGAGKLPPLLVFGGEITRAGRRTFEPQVIASISRHLKRMRRLHCADWYLNRAFFHTMLGAEWLATRHTHSRSRNDAYWASAALKALSSWRVGSERLGVAPPAARGLAPPASDTQRTVLWNVQHASTLRDVRAAMAELQDCFRNTSAPTVWHPDEEDLAVNPMYSLGYERLSKQDLLAIVEHVNPSIVVDVSTYPRTNNLGLGVDQIKGALGARYQWAGDLLGRPPGLYSAVTTKGLKLAIALAKQATKASRPRATRSSPRRRTARPRPRTQPALNTPPPRAASILLLGFTTAPGYCHRHQAIARPLLATGVDVRHIFEGEIIRASELERWFTEGGEYEYEDLW